MHLSSQLRLAQTQRLFHDLQRKRENVRANMLYINEASKTITQLKVTEKTDLT